jgi:ribosomal protein S18 acetylase RimI-like enzyme
LSAYGVLLLFAASLFAGRCGHIANASYAVGAAARGKGVGRALVEDSIAKLAPCGFTGLQFNAVVASNARAIALYEKLGFTKVGTIPGGFKNGEGALEDIHIFYHPATQAK